MKITPQPISIRIRKARKDSKHPVKYGAYVCEKCGKEYEAMVSNVRRRKRAVCKSCSAKTHGLSNTKLYDVLWGMRARCENKNQHEYKNYGGRGISVCDEWQNDFMSFYNWAMANGYKEGLSIDRIDNDGNYEPSNCRWTTKSVQAQNKRGRKHSTQYRGVWVHKKGQYRSQIIDNGKRIDFGVFDNPKDAARAYDEYVVKNGTAHTRNFS